MPPPEVALGADAGSPPPYRPATFDRPDGSPDPWAPAPALVPPAPPAEPIGAPAASVPPISPASAALPAGPLIPAGPPIPLATTRGLLPAAFDLIARASDDMRRASFYIGAVTLGTVGPFALGMWAIVVSDQIVFDMIEGPTGDSGGLLVILALIAMVGFIVASVESRTLATAVLGGRMAGRPITLRHAVARARARFWQAAGASLVVGIALAIAQGIVDAVVSPVLGANSEASLITSTVVTATVGAPFAYVLSGIVLGDVGALEAIRRSFTVARARLGAAAIIVTFETVSVLLILFGLSAGADLVLRAFTFLGIGPDSGPAGLAMATIALVAVVFALGTLLYTVTALTIAPQVVMFVGLTHATVGLDRVEDARTARFYSRPMLVGVFVAILFLVALVLTVS